MSGSRRLLVRAGRCGTSMRWKVAKAAVTPFTRRVIVAIVVWTKGEAMIVVVFARKVWVASKIVRPNSAVDGTGSARIKGHGRIKIINGMVIGSSNIRIKDPILGQFSMHLEIGQAPISEYVRSFKVHSVLAPI